MHPQPASGEVDVEHSAKVARALSINGTKADDSGVVHQVSDGAKSGERQVNCSLPVGLTGHIMMGVHHLLAQLSCEGLTFRIQNVGGQHLGSGRYKFADVLGPHASGSSGDDNHMAFK